MCRAWSESSGGGAKMDRCRRLNRSISAPRRCSVCSKMVFFGGVPCAESGGIRHEGCATPVGPTKSDTKHPEDDEDPTVDWKVVSLDSEVANFEAAHAEFKPEISATPSRRSTFGTLIAMSGLYKVATWLKQRNRSGKVDTLAKAAGSCSATLRAATPAKSGLVDKRKSSKSGGKMKRNSFGVFPSVLAHHVEGRSSSRHPSRTGQCSLHSPNGSLSSSGFTSRASSAAQTPSDSETDYRILREKFVRLHATAARGWSVSERRHGHTGVVATVTGDARAVKPHPRAPGQTLSVQGRFGRQWMTKAKTFSLESKVCTVERLCATWPPIGKNATHVEETIDDGESGIGLDCDDQDAPSKQTWDGYICFRDLEIKERILHGRRGDIYKGQWHGDVLIYIFRHHSEQQISHFWEEVSQLNMIRHDNIVLFMGACEDPPRYAIVTSMRKGPSLYEHIHIKRQHLNFSTKLNIARQVAQAMGYLHAKGVVHRNLNSKSVILEGRVQLCLLDQGIVGPEVGKDSGPNYGCLPRGYLTYLSPELMRVLRVEPPEVIVPAHHHTQESDVYSFGSLLYEILFEHYPHPGKHPHTIIWLTATGIHQELDDVKCTGSLKDLLLDCWSISSSRRPNFAVIVRELQENIPLHKRHSSSEPERLHKSGLGMAGRGLYG